MKTANENQSVDFWLLLTALVLAGTGLVMVYSSSMYLSMDRIGDGMFYFKKQAMRFLIGLCVMIVLTKINYRGYAKLGIPLLVFGFIVLIALLIQKQVSGKGGESVEFPRFGRAFVVTVDVDLMVLCAETAFIAA